MLLLWSFRICLMPVVFRDDVAMQVAVVTFTLRGYVLIQKSLVMDRSPKQSLSLIHI